MKKIPSFGFVTILLYLLVLPVFALAAPVCTYHLNKDSVQVSYVAYKTTQKLPVQGQFKKITITGESSAKSLSALARGLTLTVDKGSSNTGNPVRDQTLADFFFALLKPQISGKIANLQESDHSLVLDLNFNGVEKQIPLHYEIKDDKTFIAKGSFDLLDFQGQKAFDSIHKKCFDLHKGGDGVSKTWSEVSLQLSGDFTKDCH